MTIDDLIARSLVKEEVLEEVLEEKVPEGAASSSTSLADFPAQSDCFAVRSGGSVSVLSPFLARELPPPLSSPPPSADPADAAGPRRGASRVVRALFGDAYRHISERSGGSFVSRLSGVVSSAAVSWLMAPRTGARRRSVACLDADDPELGSSLSAVSLAPPVRRNRSVATPRAPYAPQDQPHSRQSQPHHQPNVYQGDTDPSLEPTASTSSPHAGARATSRSGPLQRLYARGGPAADGHDGLDSEGTQLALSPSGRPRASHDGVQGHPPASAPSTPAWEQQQPQLQQQLLDQQQQQPLQRFARSSTPSSSAPLPPPPPIALMAGGLGSAPMSPELSAVFKQRQLPVDGLLFLAPCARASMWSAARGARWSMDQYELTRKLYTGYASSVHKATCLTSSTDVVLKTYKLSSLTDFLRHQVLRELDIHSRMRSPSVVQLLAAFKEGDTLALVMEYVRGGSLDGARRKLGGRMNEQWAAHLVVLPLLRALRHVHRMGIVHRDIKPENLLFTPDWRLKLCDFGVSIFLNEERAVTRAGSHEYMAPEVASCPLKHTPEDNKVDGSLAYGAAADVWSLGSVVYELMTGFPPFPCGPPAVAMRAAAGSSKASTDKEASGVVADGKEASGKEASGTVDSGKRAGEEKGPGGKEAGEKYGDSGMKADEDEPGKEAGEKEEASGAMSGKEAEQVLNAADAVETAAAAGGEAMLVTTAAAATDSSAPSPALAGAAAAAGVAAAAHRPQAAAQAKAALPLAFPSSVSPAARAFISACLEPHPGDRLTVEQLLHHEWVMNAQQGCQSPAMSTAGLSSVQEQPQDKPQDKPQT